MDLDGIYLKDLRKPTIPIMLELGAIMMQVELQFGSAFTTKCKL
jgi:hypothetical protein